MRFQAFETFAERIGVLGKLVGARELISRLEIVGDGSRPALRKRRITRLGNLGLPVRIRPQLVLTRRSLTNESQE